MPCRVGAKSLVCKSGSPVGVRLNPIRAIIRARWIACQKKLTPHQIPMRRLVWLDYCVTFKQMTLMDESATFAFGAPVLLRPKK